MSIIKQSGQVFVNDSNLTAAGGHVNHIALNIAVNHPALPDPIPRSVWLRTLGEWLLGPHTPLSATPPSPPDSGHADVTTGVAGATPPQDNVRHPDGHHHGIDIVSFAFTGSLLRCLTSALVGLPGAFRYSCAACLECSTDSNAPRDLCQTALPSGSWIPLCQSQAQRRPHKDRRHWFARER
jgi:hypothetical protein